VLPQSLLLAGPGVIISTVCTAVFGMIIFPYGWSWPVALLFGAILSATDPVSVVAALDEIGAPSKLTVLIEGESLLNDGSAYVLFLIFKSMAAGTHGDEEVVKIWFVDAADRKHVYGMFMWFVQLAFGGPLVGWICGILASSLLMVCHADLLPEVSILLLSWWGTFYLAENVFHVSGT
jgi:NhaP-type Na+/H+ or K+/H+ antiporter